MKIRCDVCDREEASVFCSADEAALCDGCDKRVHHANKLAGKHTRFSLLHPGSNKLSPLCDICQERRAFVFCQEDRAILCRECDIPIHRANEHTQNHNRFLLTGVKLSTSSQTSNTEDCTKTKQSSSTRKGGSRASSKDEISSSTTTTTTTTTEMISPMASTSSLSEYLMETLPGWHVEDFLDPSSPFVSSSTNGFFCKTNSQVETIDDNDEKDDAGFESNKNFLSSVSSQDLVPQYYSQATSYSPSTTGDFGASHINYSVRPSQDFILHFNPNQVDTVPQITPPTLKRHRHFH